MCIAPSRLDCFRQYLPAANHLIATTNKRSQELRDENTQLHYPPLDCSLRSLLRCACETQDSPERINPGGRAAAAAQALHRLKSILGRVSRWRSCTPACYLCRHADHVSSQRRHLLSQLKAYLETAAPTATALCGALPVPGPLSGSAQTDRSTGSTHS